MRTTMLRALGGLGATGRRWIWSGKYCQSSRTALKARASDVVVVGGGHNGLVAATLLARKGLEVTVVEEKSVVGGACKTEYPFEKVPGLGASTGAYLLGIMPPELIEILGIQVTLLQRDPYYFLPTTGEQHLLFGLDEAKMKQQILKYFSQRDWEAIKGLQEELSIFRDDVGHTWLMEPSPIEEIAAAHVRASHRDAFVDLCRGSVFDYLSKFGFESDFIKAMYVITDGLIGTNANYDTPGTGMNFLVHNMTRLPNSQGSWMLVRGGMGSITQSIAKKAIEAGAKILTGCKVDAILMNNGSASGIVLEDGKEIHSSTLLVNADPFRMRDLVGGHGVFPSDFDNKLDSMQRDGSSFKLNLAMRGLPKFTCLDSQEAYQGTIHIIPEGADIWEKINEDRQGIREGRLPQLPCMEAYVHTVLDPSLQDEQGHHNAALFVDGVPYELKDTTWEQEKENYSNHLLTILDKYAPGTSDLVVDMFPLSPPDIESHFGMNRGHIQHVDNIFGFSDRVPYATPIPGLYSCSAGTHPAGSVIGCAGHNCAMKVAKDLGLSN